MEKQLYVYLHIHSPQAADKPRWADARTGRLYKYKKVKRKDDIEHEEQKDNICQPEGWGREVDALHTLRQLPGMEASGRVCDRHRPAEDYPHAAPQGHGALRGRGGALRGAGFRCAGSGNHAAAHGLGFRHRGFCAFRLAG